MSAISLADCPVCQSVNGVQRLSPGPFIYEGRYWLVDHAYPVALQGWLVIVLRRHGLALHDLHPEEFHELGIIQYRTVQTLFRSFGCAKEYALCMGEAVGFQHLHVHIVPRAEHLPDRFRGTDIFKLKNVAADQQLSAKEIQELSSALRNVFDTIKV